MNEAESCCVCMQSTRLFTKIRESDAKGVKWSRKLVRCVPEVDWNENWSVCASCGAVLDGVCEFKAMCIDSDAKRREFCDAKSEPTDKAFASGHYLRRHSVKAHAKATLEDGDDCRGCKIEFATSDAYDCLGTIDGERRAGDVTNISPTRIGSVAVVGRVVKANECRQKLTDIRITKRRAQHDGHERDGAHKTDQKLFACDECDGAFNTSSNLFQHKKYHAGNRTHTCSYCGKGFVTKGDLNVHEKHHLNKREYGCELCPKSFNTHKDRRSHKLVVHTDPDKWRYACSYCDKRFPIKSNFDVHTRRHTGDKRFACHLCDKRFVEKIVLQKHIRSHSNVRAHKCGECEKEYKDRRMLEIHLKRVHDIGDVKVPVQVKKHFCAVCPKSYYAKNKLTRHMCTHTGVKPHHCDVCHKKFSDKSYVKQHLKTVHNVLCEFNNKEA